MVLKSQAEKSGNLLSVFFDLVPKIKELVDDILNAKIIKKNTSDLERQIDQLIYQLYNLTPEEIQIIESSIK